MNKVQTLFALLAVACQLLAQNTIQRDKNRCADCFWGIANETRNTPERNCFLARLLQTGKDIDTTRLFVAAYDLARFDRQADKFVMHDDFYQHLDLVGISPWILYDFRSPTRLHQTFQNGFNRKGLVGDNGQRKQAWYIIHDYYKQR